MKRSEVAVNRAWDLTGLFENDQQWDEFYKATANRLSEVTAANGKLGDKATLLACLKNSDSIGLDMVRLYGYAHMNNDLNQADSKYKAMVDKFMMLNTEFATAMSFFSPQLSSLDEKYLQDCIADKDFADYDYSLQGVIRNKKYILSEKEERILAMSHDATDGYEAIFSMIDNVEVPFGTVTMEDGSQVKLTNGLYGVLLANRNKDIRRQAYECMYNAFKSLSNTLAASLSGYVKANIFNAAARGFETPQARALNANDVPVGVYNNLIKSVNDNVAPLHRYVALRKKILKLDTLNMYDMYVPLVENAELKMDYDSAYALVLEALKPLGQEYLDTLKYAYEHRWIDVEETENKRGGAYCSGVARPHPYVLLNYQQTTSDVFTIAHEMGHAMHSFYSNKTQPLAKADYSIFVAEVASTVNETLMLKYLINKEKDVKLRKYLLSYYLDMFRTTLFRQTMFAQFEMQMHDMQQNHQPLTCDALCEKYLELNRKYYGEAVVHDDYIKYEWARIPHFYYNFYVYQYSTGITSAINIAHMLLTGGDEALAKYKTFLSSGGKKSPYEILKDCGVDLMTSHPFDVAMQEFNDALTQLEEMSKD